MKLTVADLHVMKRDGSKIAALVCWDSATAKAADEAGIELVSVGDSATEDLDELAVYTRAVQRGVSRALVSCDLPEPSVENARRLVEAGADLVKVEGVENVRTLATGGIAVFGQIEDAREAKRMEDAGAALIDFRHSGPDAGAQAVAAVAIPVLGGLGGGPWLDGRVRAASKLLDLERYADDVRAGRRVRGD